MLTDIAEKKDLKDELTDQLKAALQEFADVFQPHSTRGRKPRRSRRAEKAAEH